MPIFNHILYIDPGSGSLLFQMLLSGLLTILVFFKKISLHVRALFSKKNDNSLWYKEKKR